MSAADRERSSRGPRRIPSATYRLQFNSDFTFVQAAEILSYLRDLNISDCYASPLFQPRPGSTHGYDVCSFTRLNSSLCDQKSFEAFADKLHQLEMGLLLDIVPNHMGADLSNEWWFDVLERGPASPYANFFDINWSPCNPELQNKVLLPVLGDHLGNVLEKGEIKLIFANDSFAFAYYDKNFPASPSTNSTLLEEIANLMKEESSKFRAAIEKLLARFNANNEKSREELARLLDRQHYRLAFWRVGSEEINYRRFFDVTELVSVKVELPEVFEAAHRLIFDLIRSQIVTGLRVDHPDGLWNPKEYFVRLQKKFREAVTAPDSNTGFYVVVEKILSEGESLPLDWPVDGTTGYDFLNQLNGIFIDSTNSEQFDGIYRDFTEINPDFSTAVYLSKKKILENSLVSELTELTRLFRSLSVAHRRDFTLAQLKTVLLEVLAAFPVYRTYITESSAKPSPAEKIQIEHAIASARQRIIQNNHEALEFLRKILLLNNDEDSARKEEERRFVMKFQQLSGPATAKGLEDTAFYCFNRFVSLNEVGGNPGCFGNRVEDFHQQNAERKTHWPHALLSTATHDTKRGEDVRARLNVLSEIPAEWRNAVNRWREINEKQIVKGEPAPDANDEYLFYQTLIGAWPDSAVNPEFVQRIVAYMLKAIKEAKRRTSWIDPNSNYEDALKHFVEAALSKEQFLEEFSVLQKKTAFFGRINSLAQTLLKLTAPGVPDIYQGCELWDLNLVDPDNRRPVDYDLRRRCLDEIKSAIKGGEPLSDFTKRLLQNAETGQIKLFVIHQALDCRSRHRDIFQTGDYVPLTAEGMSAKHICAFARRTENKEVFVAVSRFSATLMQGKEDFPLGKTWGNTTISIAAAPSYRNVFTGEMISADRTQTGSVLRCEKLFAEFPVALLERVG